MSLNEEHWALCISLQCKKELDSRHSNNEMESKRRSERASESEREGQHASLLHNIRCTRCGASAVRANPESIHQ